MKRLATLMTLALVALAGCSGRNETPMTGAYGSSMLTGQVSVTGMADTSPAGVEVSVRGTGMTAILSTDGQFAFSNVPDDAQLDFRRPADGIEASLQLDGASGFLNVELDKATATVTAKGGRRRSAGRGGEKIYEFEGVIRSATETSIVVFTSHKQDVTIGLTPDTVIRKGGTLLAPADLLVDTRVHVKAKSVDGAFSAVLVIVQNPEDDEDDDDTPLAVREYEGTVVSASATELVVFTSHKEEVTFILDDETVIRHGSATFNLAQVLVGMLVHVKAVPNADGTNLAKLVIVQNTRVTARIEGVVSSVDASSLVVTTGDGDRTVQVIGSTQIRKGGKKIPLTDIEVGDEVAVEGTFIDATTIQAKKITVES